MYKKFFIVFPILIAFNLLHSEVVLYTPPKPQKIAQRLFNYKGESVLIWVFFTDKGIYTKSEYDSYISKVKLTDAARKRRLKMKSSVVGFHDLPVCRRYIDRIKDLGGIFRTASNWLNAASFEIQPGLMYRIADFPFVREIREVAVYKKRIQREKGKPPGSKPKGTYIYDYGLSEDQLKILGITEAHNKGYTGQGVKIGILDTGFDREHKALRQVWKKGVIAEHDFNSGEYLIFEDSLTNKNFYQIENIIAFSNNDTMYAVFEAFNYDCNREIYLASSMDNGVSWADTNISNTDGISSSPAALFDSALYIAWQDNDDSLCGGDYDILFWNGDTIVNVSFDNEPSTTPSLAKGSIYFHLVWNEGDSIMYLMYARSSDGLWWETKDITIAQKPGPPTIVSMNDSTLAVVFADSSGNLYYTTSFDTGTTWDSPVVIDSFAAEPELCASGDSVLHLVFSDISGWPVNTIGYKRFTDTTWSEKKNLSHYSPFALGKFDIAVSGQEVYVIYEDYGNIFLLKSTNNGSDWSSPDPLTENGFCHSPAVSDNDHKFWVMCGDDTTSEQEGDSGVQQGHGTAMLSLIGGYQAGQLYGSAFNAEFILAKTEKVEPGPSAMDTFDYEVEEDWWVDGLEWAEAKGADIVSSSLGYLTWYTYDDLDGNTAVTTKAADIAASLGVLVVNAAGNIREGQTHQEALVAPTDADSIISVGGVMGIYMDSTYHSSSAYGPLIDQRGKPEVCGPWYAWAASYAGPDSFDMPGGTSCATAIIAGLCALVMEANPSWTNMEVRKAVLATSSLSPLDTNVVDSLINCGGTPTDSLGWGIPNAMRAILYEGPPPVPLYSEDVLLPPNPNPFLVKEHEKIWFRYRLHNHSLPILRIYTISGELVREFDLGERKPGRYVNLDGNSDFSAVYWEPKDLASGVYIAVLQTGFTNSFQKFAIIR